MNVKINGISFAPFRNPTEGIGIYKKRKRGVMFYDQEGSPLVFLVANPGYEQFFVTAYKHGEKIYYMHALTTRTKKMLGFTDLMQERDQARKIWNLLNTDMSK